MIRALLMAAAALALAGCYRHEVLVAAPTEPRPAAQVREHGLGHLIEDTTVELDAFCDRGVGRLYVRGLWYSSAITATEVYCRARATRGSARPGASDRARAPAR